MLSPAAHYKERELAIASLQVTLRQHALAHDAFASLAAVQLINGCLALGATLGLCVYEWVVSGPQRLLLLSLLRLSALLCVGLVAHKAFGTRVHSFLGIHRPALYRVAVYLQILWFTSELLLGSALLAFVPLLQGTELEASAAATATLYGKVLPVLYMVGMAGCLCFLTQLRNKRRCSKSSKGIYSPSHSGHWIDQEAGQPRLVECGLVPAGQLGGQAGMGAGTAQAAAVTCEIVLLEHQLDTNECVLFVHKKLRPIKTRPDSPNYLPLLKPMIASKPPAPQLPLPAAAGPQHALPPTQPPPLINLGPVLAAPSAAQQHPSKPSFTSPMQRLQQLAAASSHQRQLSTAQSLSFSSMRDGAFATCGSEVPTHLAPQQQGAGAGDSSSGAMSITGRCG